MKGHILLFLVVGINFSFAQEWIRPFKEAEQAYKKKDYLHFYMKMKEANHLHPYHLQQLHKVLQRHLCRFY